MIIESKEGCFFDIKVIPKASKTEIAGYINDRLKIKVNAVPEDGKANKELISFLSKKLKIPKSKISVSKGSTSSLKTLFFYDTVKEQLLSLLD